MDTTWTDWWTGVHSFCAEHNALCGVCLAITVVGLLYVHLKYHLSAPSLAAVAARQRDKVVNKHFIKAVAAAARAARKGNSRCWYYLPAGESDVFLVGALQQRLQDVNEFTKVESGQNCVCMAWGPAAPTPPHPCDESDDDDHDYVPATLLTCMCGGQPRIVHTAYDGYHLECCRNSCGFRTYPVASKKVAVDEWNARQRARTIPQPDEDAGYPAGASYFALCACGSRPRVYSIGKPPVWYAECPDCHFELHNNDIYDLKTGWRKLAWSRASQAAFPQSQLSRCACGHTPTMFGTVRGAVKYKVYCFECHTEIDPCDDMAGAIRAWNEKLDPTPPTPKKSEYSKCEALPRYFVDERVGCIAVRDRTLTDPSYQGLHSDTPGVVYYNMGYPNTDIRGQLMWYVSDVQRRGAYEVCAENNKKDRASS